MNRFTKLVLFFSVPALFTGCMEADLSKLPNGRRDLASLPATPPEPITIDVTPEPPHDVATKLIHPTVIDVGTGDCRRLLITSTSEDVVDVTYPEEFGAHLYRSNACTEESRLGTAPVRVLPGRSTAVFLQSDLLRDETFEAHTTENATFVIRVIARKQNLVESSLRSAKPVVIAPNGTRLEIDMAGDVPVVASTKLPGLALKTPYLTARQAANGAAFGITATGLYYDGNEIPGTSTPLAVATTANQHCYAESDAVYCASSPRTNVVWVPVFTRVAVPGHKIFDLDAVTTRTTSEMCAVTEYGSYCWGPNMIPVVSALGESADFRNVVVVTQGGRSCNVDRFNQMSCFGSRGVVTMPYKAKSVMHPPFGGSEAIVVQTLDHKILVVSHQDPTKKYCEISPAPNVVDDVFLVNDARDPCKKGCYRVNGQLSCWNGVEKGIATIKSTLKVF